LSYDPGGSGNFFYVAAALKVNGNYCGTNVVLLGDRIVPQNLKIRNGVVVADYSGRQPQEPMAILPSIDRSMHLIIERNTLIAIVLDSEWEEVLEG
jgi:hypothetical protein